MELWDLYTYDRQKTGHTMLRGDGQPEGLFRLVVHVCIFNSDGEMLIQQRQPFKKGWPNLWDITVGGSALSGEDSRNAIARELYIMSASKYLKYIVDEIHTTVVATVDDDGLPVTAAIDMMDYDESGLYFLTAKGKGFYNRLKKQGYIALTGIKGNDTMTSAAISVCGKAQEVGTALLPRLFEKNPYMNEIYPTAESQKALTVFHLYEGSGEWFDLSKKPIERVTFTFGGTGQKREGYFITDACIGCRVCEAVCPQSCIDFSLTPAVIRQENCLHCGNCMSVCPQNAVVREV